MEFSSRAACAGVDRMADEKMRQYSTGWSDEQVIEWDGNFRDDGALFLICSERDIEIAEYQRVEECVRYWDRVRGVAAGICRGSWVPVGS
jgi:hypothetical protein